MADKSNTKELAFTLVAEDQQDTLATAQDLRAALEKGTDELKLDTLRRIIISTLNGQPQVSRVAISKHAHAVSVRRVAVHGRMTGVLLAGARRLTLTRPRCSRRC